MKNPFYRKGALAATFTLLALASVASTVTPRTVAVPTQGEQFIAETVIESPAWRAGYDLVDGSDDYEITLRETQGQVLDVTPNEEVAGELIEIFEDFEAPDAD